MKNKNKGKPDFDANLRYKDEDCWKIFSRKAGVIKSNRDKRVRQKLRKRLQDDMSDLKE